jgi:hypothetical protein
MKDGMTNGHVVGRAEGGRWLPGMSANPSGRPVGARARYAGHSRSMGQWAALTPS